MLNEQEAQKAERKVLFEVNEQKKPRETMNKMYIQ